MRLTILPGSLWIAYTLTSPNALDSLVPEHTRVAPTRLLKHDAQTHRLLVNAYQISAPYMRGTRVDVQTLVENRRTGRKHLVIVDVLTDTMHWNPRDGILPPNARCAMSPQAARFCRLGGAMLDVTIHANRGKRAVDHGFVVEANRKCYFRDCRPGLEMTFDEKHVAMPVSLLHATVENTMWTDVRGQKPTHVFRHNQQMTFDVQLPTSVLWG